MPEKDLVIAVDNSEDCLKAVEFALTHFSKGYIYHLVHIVPKPASDTRLAADQASGVDVHVRHMYDKQQEAASKKLLEDVFVPKAKSLGAKVTAILLTSDSDSSTSIGHTICLYVHQQKPEALILMKQNKGAVQRFFIGSVTRYCATESDVPVIIVPP